MNDFNNCQDKSDAEIVRLVFDDQDHFLCLMKRYESRLLRYILRISNSHPDEAEDILQEVFIKVYLNLHSFDQSLKFSSWIYRITHNEVISNYRKNKARPQTIILDINSNILENIASNLDTQREVDLKYLADNIEQILNQLDKKYREVLVLRFLEEKDYREISDILKKPAGTVATLLNRAKKKFKEELDRQNIKI